VLQVVDVDFDFFSYFQRYMTRFQQAMADWFIPLEHDPHFLASGIRVYVRCL
jgi:hypothetical protein